MNRTNNFNKHSQNAVALIIVIIAFCIGVQQLRIATQPQLSSEAEFISGQLVANVGELCVFNLNEPTTRADWIIVPSATSYVDSSGSSLAFASNVSAKYTIIAAIVENGQPKILTHVCDYGNSPEPIPLPIPTPIPLPTPITLSEWVTQNIPQDGVITAAALASVYQETANSIDNGTIKTIDAAFATIRTATQTKVVIVIWQPFLDELSVKITEQLGESNDVKKLGTIFSDIAKGLKGL